MPAAIAVLPRSVLPQLVQHGSTAWTISTATRTSSTEEDRSSAADDRCGIFLYGQLSWGSEYDDGAGRDRDRRVDNKMLARLQRRAFLFSVPAA